MSILDDSMLDDEMVDRIRAAAAEIHMTVPVEAVRRRTRQRWRLGAVIVATVVAATGGLVAGTAIAPGGGTALSPAERTCRSEGTVTLRGAQAPQPQATHPDHRLPDRPPLVWPKHLPPLRYQVENGPAALLVFSDDRFMMACHLYYGGLTGLNLQLATPGHPFPWTHPADLPFYFAGGQGGTALTVVVGWVPPDTTDVSVVMDGQSAYQIRRDGDTAAQVFVALIRVDPGDFRDLHATVTATTGHGVITQDRTTVN